MRQQLSSSFHGEEVRNHHMRPVGSKGGGDEFRPQRQNLKLPIQKDRSIPVFRAVWIRRGERRNPHVLDRWLYQLSCPMIAGDDQNGVLLSQSTSNDG